MSLPSREVLEKRVRGIKTLLGALPLLEDPHIEFLLLHSCYAFPMFAFSLRTSNTSSQREVRQEFDRLVR